MGVCLAYQTGSELAPEIRVQILREAEKINAGRRWWCEPIIFDVRTDGAGRLSGDTKVFLPGYTSKGEYVEVDFEEDSFMACHDALFIMARLEDWARRYSLVWELELEGPIGTISAEGADDAVQEIRSILAQQSGYDLANPSANDARVAAIDTKYASRNED